MWDKHLTMFIYHLEQNRAVFQFCERFELDYLHAAAIYVVTREELRFT